MVVTRVHPDPDIPTGSHKEVIDIYGHFGFFDGLTRVNAWRNALRNRPAVRGAVVEDYHERLRAFFLGLDSELGRLVEAADFRLERQTIN